MLNYYQILNVSPTAAPAEIKSAFRRKVRQLHPDLQPESDRLAFQQVVEAYRILSEPSSRRQYDLYWTLFTGFSGQTPPDLYSPLDWITDIVRDYSPLEFIKNLRHSIIDRITGTLRFEVGRFISWEIPLFIPMPLPLNDPAHWLPLPEIVRFSTPVLKLSVVSKVLELYNSGLEALNKNAYENAEQLLKRAIDLQPGFVLSHLALGNVYRLIGRIEHARHCYRRTLELDTHGVAGRLAARYLQIL